MSQVYLKCGIEAEHQRLIFGGKELEDKKNGVVKTVKYYGIFNEATIMLVIRLPGGIK